MGNTLRERAHDIYNANFYSSAAVNSFHLSDTIGGEGYERDLTKRTDIDANITIANRSGWTNHHQTFDTRGRAGIVPYVFFETHRQATQEHAGKGKIVLMGNGARRIGQDNEAREEDGNGTAFFAFKDDNLWLVGHLSHFQHIKHIVKQYPERFYEIVNFRKKQQFRSSELEDHIRFRKNRKHAPEKIDLIPDPAEATAAKVDTFGSIDILCADQDAFRQRIKDAVITPQEGPHAGHPIIGGRIGDIQRTLRVELGEEDTLGANIDRGFLTLYVDQCRGDRFKIAWPWTPEHGDDEDAAVQVENSPFYAFSRPQDYQYVDPNADEYVPPRRQDFIRENTPFELVSPDIYEVFGIRGIRESVELEIQRLIRIHWGDSAGPQLSERLRDPNSAESKNLEQFQAASRSLFQRLEDDAVRRGLATSSKHDSSSTPKMGKSAIADDAIVRQAYELADRKIDDAEQVAVEINDPLIRDEKREQYIRDRVSKALLPDEGEVGSQK